MKNQVIIYSKNNCPYCTQAKSLLSRNKISYEEISLEDVDNREKFLYDYPLLKTVPQIFVENEEQRVLLGGYTELEKYYKKAIENPLDDLYGLFTNPL